MEIEKKNQFIFIFETLIYKLLGVYFLLPSISGVYLYLIGLRGKETKIESLTDSAFWGGIFDILQMNLVQEVVAAAGMVPQFQYTWD